MESYHVQRRSASHGSLRSSYKSHGRPPAGFSLPHRPLRSVNENASLLPSPGPLESMLKTTTETGDIGIFTIKPVAPAATTHVCARSRSGIDASSIFRPESRGSNRTESRISRRRQCSERDTNSEIISMYGSERNSSPRVASLSPRSGPAYQRSFSLTSNVSRQLPRQRSSSTLRSPSSGGTLQRPRSPFPYPTRLKRPGIRPSSPALTENGHVDYSRMVEIDRISHRTVHGSYKPAYAIGQRLAPPPSFRSGDVHSMPALPHPSSMTSIGPAVRNQGHWASSTHSGHHGRPTGTRRPSVGQSRRSSSLTSVIDMYYRPASSLDSQSVRTLRPTGSFYYDYTEGFESPEEQTGTPNSVSATPLAPVPQRVSSLARALVLRDETKARLDAVVDISVKDSSEASGDDSRIPCEDELDFKNDLPILDLFSFEVDGTSASQPLSFDKDKKNGDLQCRGSDDEGGSSSRAQGATLGADFPPHEPEALEASPIQIQSPQPEQSTQRQDDSPSEAGITGNATPAPVLLPKSSSAPAACDPGTKPVQSQGGLAALLRSSLRQSVDPGLSDLAGLVASFERISRTPFSRTEKESIETSTDPGYLDEKNSQDIHPRDLCDRKTASADDGNVPSCHSHVKASGIKPFSKGHRRNRAIMRISTSSLRCTIPKLTSKADTPLLCPEPISPARILKVRNSIPQLMKALPSTPDDARYRSLEAPETSAKDLEVPVTMAPFQLEILATPRSSPKITVNLDAENHEPLKASIEIEFGPEMKTEDVPDPKNSPPKVATHPVVGDDAAVARQLGEASTPGNQRGAAATEKPPRSRLRMSTSQRILEQDSINQKGTGGTVRRNAGFLNRHLLYSLEEHRSESRPDPSQRPACPSSPFYQRKGRQFLLVAPDGRSGRNLHPSTSSANSNFNGGYLQEGDIPLAHPVHSNLARTNSSIDGYDLTASRSFSSDLTFRRPRMLRKKLSDLRIRMTRSRLNISGRAKNPEHTHRPDGQIGPAKSDATTRVSVFRAKGVRVWFRRAVHIISQRRQASRK
ncbi:hypothetical protein CMUS01_04629 [Colletotrichum musicola]|uniref:Uncharacterized protein n=1 Tax=Colletotrichum musicola TaxID=2175873 RepID=A0A8H6KVI2_9PEZI|nr:hypothetical protein CMUS01_04629 [Colletotrichum musicola]